MTPRISVVTPTKNRRALLLETIASVRAQTMTDWEQVIVDDGSDDGTTEAVGEIATQDPRVRFMPRTGKESGGNGCRNQGIRAARAELIVFLDSDDLLRPHALAGRVQAMDRNRDLDFALFQGSVFNSSVDDLNRLYHENPPGDDLLCFLSSDIVWEITSPVWRKTYLDRIGYFDLRMRSMQDVELHVRALCADAKYVLFRIVDHDIRWNQDSSRTSARHFQDPSFYAATARTPSILRKHLAERKFLTWSRDRALVGLSFETAEQMARSGRLVDALRIWRRSQSPSRTLFLHLFGSLLLLGLALNPRHQRLFSRLVARWKGFARFRQEPAVWHNTSIR